MITSVRERFSVIGAALILATAGVVFLLVRTDDKPKARSVKPSLAITPQLDSNGLILATLLSQARHEDYHATYTSTADPSVSGGSIGMEIWNTQGKSRIDTTLTTPDKKVVHTASVLVGKKSVVCQEPPGETWTCRSAPQPAAGDASGLVALLQSQLAGRSVTEAAGKVGNRPARCFSVGASAGAEQIEICVDDHGILLQLKSSDARIEINSLDTATPPDRAFKLPAAVKG